MSYSDYGDDYSTDSFWDRNKKILIPIIVIIVLIAVGYLVWKFVWPKAKNMFSSKKKGGGKRKRSRRNVRRIR